MIGDTFMIAPTEVFWAPPAVFYLSIQNLTEVRFWSPSLSLGLELGLFIETETKTEAWDELTTRPMKKFETPRESVEEKSFFQMNYCRHVDAVYFRLLIWVQYLSVLKMPTWRLISEKLQDRDRKQTFTIPRATKSCLLSRSQAIPNRILKPFNFPRKL